MKRKNTTIGDVFAAKLDNGNKKYLQYITNDLTQLNSDIIRVFKKEYPVSENFELAEIVKGEVEFYAHCVTKWGIKLGFWEKVGNIDDVGKIDIFFRSSGDDGNSLIKVSNNWWVWKINEEQRFVGKLVGDYRKAEIGSVIPPNSIIYRMQTGRYDFIYPEYE